MEVARGLDEPREKRATNRGPLGEMDPFTPVHIRDGREAGADDAAFARSLEMAISAERSIASRASPTLTAVGSMVSCW